MIITMEQKELEELKKLARANKYVPHGNPANADCILGFSFGYRKINNRIVPGTSNEQLARFIETQLPSLPLILQFEISDALTTAKPDLVIREHRKKGSYLDSGEIAAQAFIYMKAKNWTTAVIVTHSAMEARNDYLCTASGITTIAPKGLGEIAYDEYSEQPWTRDTESWWKREEKVIEVCFKNGWIKKPSGLSV